jgi:hypothetical protein
MTLTNISFIKFPCTNYMMDKYVANIITVRRWMTYNPENTSTTRWPASMSTIITSVCQQHRMADVKPNQHVHV